MTYTSTFKRILFIIVRKNPLYLYKSPHQLLLTFYSLTYFAFHRHIDDEVSRNNLLTDLHWIRGKDRYWSPLLHSWMGKPWKRRDVYTFLHKWGDGGHKNNRTFEAVRRNRETYRSLSPIILRLREFITDTVYYGLYLGPSGRGRGGPGRGTVEQDPDPHKSQELKVDGGTVKETTGGVDSGPEATLWRNTLVSGSRVGVLLEPTGKM